MKTTPHHFIIALSFLLLTNCADRNENAVVGTQDKKKDTTPLKEAYQEVF